MKNLTTVALLSAHRREIVVSSFGGHYYSRGEIDSLVVEGVSLLIRLRSRHKVVGLNGCWVSSRRLEIRIENFSGFRPAEFCQIGYGHYSAMRVEVCLGHNIED